MRRPLTPAQRYALITRIAGPKEIAPPGEPGVRANTWRALEARGLVDEGGLTAAGRAVLGLPRSRPRSRSGALKAAVLALLPWNDGSIRPLTGRNIPCASVDADHWEDDPISLAGHPDLVAAVDASGESDWEGQTGLCADVPWDALTEWMDAVGFPVEVAAPYREIIGIRWIYKINPV